jgi:hypothetical protein
MTPDEIRDCAALLDVIEWARTTRGDPNAEFIVEMMVDHGKTRRIVMPCWLFRLMLDDLEIYANDALQKKGINVSILDAHTSNPTEGAP